MTQHYRLTEPVTLRGEPAGPDKPNYLSFVEGDVVELVPEGDDWFWDTPEGIVVVRLVDAPDRASQELDVSSLVEL